MEAKAKLLAADLHFGNEVTTITNDEWVDYFQFAMDYHDPDFGDLRDKIRTVTPLKVKLKEGAEPIACEARRFSSLHTDFLRKHLAEIYSAGLGYDNNRSRFFRHDGHAHLGADGSDGCCGILSVILSRNLWRKVRERTRSVARRRPR